MIAEMPSIRSVEFAAFRLRRCLGEYHAKPTVDDHLKTAND
jgi:hypothetical protein